MSTFSMNWTESKEILPGDEHLPVRQVYVWLVSADRKVVIVSKDGSSWQFPGGKPAAGESLAQTATREVAEEAGVDISPYQDELTFFGYYNVHEPESKFVDYLQVRYYLPLPVESSELHLTAEGENTAQAAQDMIKFVDLVDFDELTHRIGWVGTSEEYRQLRAIV